MKLSFLRVMMGLTLSAACSPSGTEGPPTDAPTDEMNPFFTELSARTLWTLRASCRHAVGPADASRILVEELSVASGRSMIISNDDHDSAAATVRSPAP